MKANRLSLLIVGFLCIRYVKCILPEIGIGLAGAGIYAGFNSFKCRWYECCNEDHVPANWSHLNQMFATQLYGQQIAHETIVHALLGHFNNNNPQKALAMSFHGMPGCGKNYAVRMIAQALYKKGEKSEYFHFFSGRVDFPLDSKVDEYKEELYSYITKHLEKCERSLFVFDEVDKMPEGLLNVLVPFLDYSSSSRSSKNINRKNAIYIFLSNTGSTRIVKRLIELWEQGRKRDSTKLQDFENLIAIGAFNEKGGFHKSDTIEASVIDHYVPFLPLEEAHVKLCMEDAFRQRHIVPTANMIAEGMTHVTFGPPPHNLYSRAGCKRLDQKVATIIYRSRSSQPPP